MTAARVDFGPAPDPRPITLFQARAARVRAAALGHGLARAYHAGPAYRLSRLGQYALRLILTDRYEQARARAGADHAGP